jgi:hypothetical protein
LSPSAREPVPPRVPAPGRSGDGPLARTVSNEPAPELAAILREQIEHLLDAPPTLRQVAERRLQGASNAEVARRLGRVVRTVERTVELIRLAGEKIGDDR